MAATNEEIIQYLSMAIGQDYGKLKLAEAKLEELSKNELCFVKLLEIGSTKDLDWSLRWMAWIYLKNGIEKHWRKTSFEMSQSTKGIIRNALDQVMLEESTSKITIQISAVVAKIARLDWPDNWPTLMPHLLQNIAVRCSPSTFTTPKHYSASLIFYHVMKTLASKKLLRDRTIFSNFCQSIHQEILIIFSNSMEMLKCSLVENEYILKQKIYACEVTVVCFKILPHVVEYVAYPSDICISLKSSILTDLSDLLSICSAFKDEPLKTLIFKNCCKLLKLLDKLIFQNIDLFGQSVTDTFSFLCATVIKFSSTISDENRKFVIGAMNLLQKTLMDPNFVNFKELVLNELSNELLYTLIFQYLPLSQTDIEQWNSDPEEFCNEEAGESWKYNLRPCSEVLLVTLIHQYSDVFIPQLMNILLSVQNIDLQNQDTWCDIADENVRTILQKCSSLFQVALKKEAVYYAVGLSCYEFTESFKFDQWLTQKLLPEVEAVQSEIYGRVLHRRVLWLVGKWTEVSPSDNIRGILYNFVVSSLSPNFDLSIRLNASVAVQQLLDCYEFDVSLFKSHQENCFDGLYRLLHDTAECETKMRILNSFSFLIERLGNEIKVYGEKILAIIAVLWQNANDHNMLKCVILSTLNQLVVGYAEDSNVLHAVIVPLLKLSTDVGNPAHVYLLEDGLVLWLITLQNTATATNELVSLFTNITGLLELSSEVLRTCFDIIETYIVLAGEEIFTSPQGKLLSQSMCSSLSDVNEDCLVIVSRLITTMCQVSPMHAPPLFSWYLVKTFMTLFGQDNGILHASNLVLFSHIINTNPGFFWSVIEQVGNQENLNATAVLSKFIDNWCNSVDYIADVDKKKTAGLAMTVVLKSLPTVPSVEENFNLILCTIVQVLYDICDEDGVDILVGSDHGQIVLKDETCHYRRHARLKYTQSSFTLSMPMETKNVLTYLEQNVGSNLLQSKMAEISPDILSDLNNFLSPPTQ